MGHRANGLAVVVAAMGVTTGCGTSDLAKPETPVRDVVETRFGVEVHDPYRWLEDGTDPAVLSWVDDQDDFARETIAEWPGGDDIRARFLQIDSYSITYAPQHLGTRLFWAEPGPSQRIYYWREVGGTERHVLLDPNQLTNVTFELVDISRDGQKVAYAQHANNADDATLYIRDVVSGKDSTIDVFPGMGYGSAELSLDGTRLLYTQASTDPSIDADTRLGTLTGKSHVLGTDPALDRVEHEPTNNASRPGSLSSSWSRNWDEWVESDNASSSVWVRDARVVGAPWQPLLTNVADLDGLFEYEDQFYASLHDVPRGRVVRIDPAQVDPAAWTTLVPEGESVIYGSAMRGGQLVVQVGWAGLFWLQIRELDGTLIREVHGERISGLRFPSGRPDEDTFYVTEDTFLAPQQIKQGSIRTGTLMPYSTPRSSFDASQFVVEQVMYPSKDGTQVPMFILSSARRTGPGPTLMYGYGGFDINMTPGFDPRALTWLALGGVYAMPEIRGGGELGEAWHDGGRLGNKQNSFDDFIAAGEYLIARGYTTASQLAVDGASNGGLLTGAMTVQRPDLFRAVVSGVPLLDMIRYPRFGLGSAWISEYGDPDQADGFGWLYPLSPYHHVTSTTDYPSVLLLSADHDDRVDPLHARKMAAALQSAASPGRPTLLWTQRNAGHGGASTFAAYLEESADLLAFVAHETGLDVTPFAGGARSAPAPRPDPAAERRADEDAARIRRGGSRRWR